MFVSHESWSDQHDISVEKRIGRKESFDSRTAAIQNIPFIFLLLLDSSQTNECLSIAVFIIGIGDTRQRAKSECCNIDFSVTSSLYVPFSHLTYVIVNPANGTGVMISCAHFWTPNEWASRPETDSEFTDLKSSSRVISHPRQNAASSFWVAGILQWAKK